MMRTVVVLSALPDGWVEVPSELLDRVPVRVVLRDDQWILAGEQLTVQDVDETFYAHPDLVVAADNSVTTIVMDDTRTAVSDVDLPTTVVQAWSVLRSTTAYVAELVDRHRSNPRDVVSSAAFQHTTGVLEATRSALTALYGPWAGSDLAEGLKRMISALELLVSERGIQNPTTRQTEISESILSILIGSVTLSNRLLKALAPRFDASIS